MLRDFSRGQGRRGSTSFVHDPNSTLPSLSLCCTAINSPIHIYHLVRRKIGINFYGAGEEGRERNGKFLSLADASARLREYRAGFAQPLLVWLLSSISLSASITVMPRSGRALNKSRFPIEGKSARLSCLSCHGSCLATLILISNQSNFSYLCTLKRRAEDISTTILQLPHPLT